jgi:hypothetical protein
MEGSDCVRNGATVDEFIDDIILSPRTERGRPSLDQIRVLGRYIEQNAERIFAAKLDAEDPVHWELASARASLHDALVMLHEASYKVGVATENICRVAEQMQRADRVAANGAPHPPQ